MLEVTVVVSPTLEPILWRQRAARFARPEGSLPSVWPRHNAGLNVVLSGRMPVVTGSPWGNSRVLNSKMLPPAVTGQLAIHHCAVPGVDKVGHARRRCAFVNFDLRLTDPKRIQPGLIRPQWFNDPTKEARSCSNC